LSQDGLLEFIPVLLKLARSQAHNELLNGVPSGTCLRLRPGTYRQKNLPWKSQHNLQGNDDDDRRDRF
jgi:hypothetical protein